MDTSSIPGGLVEPVEGDGYYIYIGVSLGIICLATTITLASYYCVRNRRPSTISPQPGHAHHQLDSENYAVVVEMGIDEETIKTYPKYLYSEASKVHFEEGSRKTITGCSICLGDYKNSDVLRELPDCGHIFHAKCIDPWLRMHPTCPLCRTSPLSTPLSQLVPLPTR